jgi:hypothetical protein
MTVSDRDRKAATAHAEPPLYDIAAALREMDVHLVAPDELTIECVAIGNKLGRAMARHDFDRRSAGQALVVAAASVGALADTIEVKALVNILAFAGRHLIRSAEQNGGDH